MTAKYVAFTFPHELPVRCCMCCLPQLDAGVVMLTVSSGMGSPDGLVDALALAVPTMPNAVAGEQKP